MRVLIVDDERILGRAIAMALRKALDAEVDVANDGPTACRLAEEHVYALAVVDWWLPPPTGRELIQIWRGSERMGPIVAMSGNQDGTEGQEALDAGASAFLEKPFPLPELIAHARTLTGGEA